MTTTYWESKFKQEGALWQFEPADSAIRAVELFESNNLHKILIPGMGYGRNAKLFLEHGFDVSGIEISQAAIDLAREHDMHFPMHCGSVTEMPFDNEMFDAIFCYALIHLLNRNERKRFLQSCYNQLNPGGLMVFSVVSTQASRYGSGRLLSKDRYQVEPGVNVFFYDNNSVIREFTDFGLLEYKDIDEPIKFMKDQEPIKMNYVVCRKD